jgi:hypothetical protein
MTVSSSFLLDDAPTNHAQQGVVAHRHHESIGESRCGSAAERQIKMVDDCLEPLSTTTVTRQDSAIELFAEDAATTENGITPNATRYDRQLYSTATEG